MINQVYSTVLAILNKDNRGYVSPLEFNLYSEMAQMSLFEELFHKYAKSIVKQNARMYHSEQSDIPKHIREVFDFFTEEVQLGYNAQHEYFISNVDFYKIIKLDYIPSFENKYNKVEIENVSKLEVNKLLRNNLVQPTESYPVYYKLGDLYIVHPSLGQKNVQATYIRKPKNPKWTYIEVNNNPLFNQSATDYVDFELPSQFFSELVIKILGYCGIEIRENDVFQIAQAIEASNNNTEQL